MPSLTLDDTHMQVLGNVLRKRVAELDNYLAKKGEKLDALDFQLTKDVRAQVAHCLSEVEGQLPAKERV